MHFKCSRLHRGAQEGGWLDAYRAVGQELKTESWSGDRLWGGSVPTTSPLLLPYPPSIPHMPAPFFFGGRAVASNLRAIWRPGRNMPSTKYPPYACCRCCCSLILSSLPVALRSLQSNLNTGPIYMFWTPTYAPKLFPKPGNQCPVGGVCMMMKKDTTSCSSASEMGSDFSFGMGEHL